MGKYPELGTQRYYDYSQQRYRDKTRVSDQEYQFSNRTGKLTDKQRVIQIFTDALDMAISLDEFNRLLKDEKLKIYQRGKTMGIQDKVSGRKYRFKTLGLLGRFEEFQQIAFELEKEHRRLVDSQQHLSKSHERNQSR